ncbi:keratin, type II cytoskeletal 5-like isoform X3 [Anabas testudineus]|uniref:keratin, type II cytoskeletal 5-like isoform X3 n=1 Tax=Anabas testudineus TaxID=64144 RepID=UPI00143D7B56|nr:keratin, type II cytoskeletal 5-like isoform X3 [Anabas testudineus]
MANFLNSLGGSDIAKLAGQKAGSLVEDTVKNALSGGKKEGKKEEKPGGGGGGGGGFGVGDALSLVSGKKNENKGGGFGVGDALSLVSGKKNENKGGGFGVGDVPSLVGKQDDKKEIDFGNILSFDDAK